MTQSKILLFDIETAPNLGYTWQKWEQDVIEFKRDWYMLSFAYKWLGDTSVKAYSLPDFSTFKKDKEDDTQLITELWKLFDQAEIVIAHNGDEFDIKKTNSRFIINGLQPPTPYKTIDTKKIAKKHFRFDSNKLDDLGNYLGLGRKIDTGGFELWKGCMAGNKDAWSKMVKYNKQDVVLLEKVYNKLLPWIDNYPVVSIDDGECRNCNSIHLQKRGRGANRFSTYQRYQCMDCGAWSKGKNEKL